jgi:hypothetical protein
VDVQIVSPSEDQARVLLEASADSDNVETILLEQVVGQVGVIDHADDTDGHLVANCLLDFDSEWSLVRWARVRVLLRVVATWADVQNIDTFVSQNWGELDGVVDRPGFGDLGHFLEPVGGGDTEEEGHILRDDLASLLDKLDSETGAVLKAATVVVLTLVGDWREEGVEQIAVSLAEVSGLMNRSKYTRLTPWISMASKPAFKARFTDAAKAALKSWISWEVISLGLAWRSFHGMALGAYTSSGQPFRSLPATAPDESQGATVLAFLPAWPSWIIIFWPW